MTKYVQVLMFPEPEPEQPEIYNHVYPPGEEPKGYDIPTHNLTLWAQGVAAGKLGPDWRVQAEYQINFMQEMASVNARRITGIKVGHFEESILPELRNRDWLILELDGIVRRRAARTEGGVTYYDGEVIEWAHEPSEVPTFLVDGTEPGEEIIGMTVPEARAHKERLNANRQTTT